MKFEGQSHWYAARFSIFALFFLLAFNGFAQTQTTRENRMASIGVAEIAVWKTQHLYCTLDYPARECAQHIVMLREKLRTYSANGFDNWKWILVRSSDWKSLLTRMGIDPAIPALTSPSDRQTLLKEDLLASNTPENAELSRQFRTTPDELFTLVLTHEMGHALCHDSDETVANRAANRLRRGERFQCAPALTTAAKGDFLSGRLPRPVPY